MQRFYIERCHLLKNRSTFDMKKFENSSVKNPESLLQDLQHGLNNNGKFAEFNDEFKAILNYHAPIKQCSW